MCCPVWEFKLLSMKRRRRNEGAGLGATMTSMQCLFNQATLKIFDFLLLVMMFIQASFAGKQDVLGPAGMSINA